MFWGAAGLTVPAKSMKCEQNVSLCLFFCICISNKRYRCNIVFFSFIEYISYAVFKQCRVAFGGVFYG